MTMTGEGMADVIRDVFQKGRELPSKIGDVAFSSKFQGERHALLKLPNGIYERANYMGPGTNLLTRLKRGDRPKTEVDKVAQAHDIRYGLARNQGDIRRADNIMINKVDEIARNKRDSRSNIAQARVMKIKRFTEDLGLLRKDAFSGNLSENRKIPASDRRLMKKKLNELAPQGYGRDIVMRPADMLKIKLLKQLARKKRKKRIKGKGITNKGKKRIKQSMSRDLGKPYRLMGQGRLPSNLVLKIIMSKVLPKLMKDIGLSLKSSSKPLILKLVKKAVGVSSKTGKMSTVINNISKVLLPILTSLKMRSMKMSGRGIVDVLKGHKLNLIKSLNKGLFNLFKAVINKGAKTRGLKPIFKGSGLKLAGRGFKDFVKAFKKVFKPVAKIAGTILSTTGNPEIGLPLSALGKIL
jgi:hypothetical protein